MKKYIVNYIFVCLVILIVTSLLYIVNNDMKEYMVGDSDNHMNVINDNLDKNLTLAARYVNDQRRSEADSLYTKYWSNIQYENDADVKILNGCGEKFSSFMYKIGGTISNDILNSELCKKYTKNEYLTLDLKDNGKDGRIKATCLNDALVLDDDKGGLYDLIQPYKVIETPVDRCRYLKNNY